MPEIGRYDLVGAVWAVLLIHEVRDFDLFDDEASARDAFDMYRGKRLACALVRVVEAFDG